MAKAQEGTEISPPAGRVFEATQWSVVLAAGEDDAERRQQALEELCRTYWEPLYCFVRRCGHEVHDAQDLTQAFFTRLLEGNHLRGVSRDKGKFRWFLLAAMRNFLADHHDRTQAAKRGGGRLTLPLTAEMAESQYRCDNSPARTAESLFDRRWALVVMNRALARLRAEFARTGKERAFAELSVFLAREGGADDYATVAQRLSMAVGSVPVAVHRLRGRYREMIRAEVADTVAGATEVEEEMRYLLELLCRE